MSTNTTKWSRKRSLNEDEAKLEERVADPLKKEWKVKTLDEILQEKRRKLDADSPDGGQESSRVSERSSATSSPSLKIESKSSSKRQSPAQEVIYQLSPEHSSPLSSASEKSLQKKSSNLKQKGRRRTEEEEGEILSDISDAEERQRSRGNSRRVSTDVEMVEKPVAEVHVDITPEQDENEGESSKDSESSEEEEVEEEVVEKDGSAQLNDEDSDSSEEDDSSDSDSEESEESSEEDEEEVQDSNKVEVEAKRKDNEDSSEEESEEESDNDSDDSEETESSEEDEQEESSTVQKELKIQGQDDEDGLVDIDKQSSRTREKQKELHGTQVDQHPKSRDHYPGETSRERRHQRHEETERSHLEKHSRRAREDRFGNSGDDRRRKGENQPEEKSRHKSNRKTIIEERDKQTVQVTSRENEGRDVEKVSERRKAKHEHSRIKEKSENKRSRERTSLKDKSKYDSPDSNQSKQEDKDLPREKRKETKLLSKDQSSSTEQERSHSPETNTRDSIPDSQTSREGTLLTEQERMQFSTEVVDSESDVEQSSSSDDQSQEELADLSESKEDVEEEEKAPELPDYLPAIQGCRNVSEEFLWLNRIEEGTYGVVYRARDKKTNEIVALKRLKMEKEKEGFPITSLREINTLLKGQHRNIVTVREIVVGDNMDKIFIVMDYVEHDLKTLMEHMSSKFAIGEVKSLLVQLLDAVAHLHDNWILHRDLKTSNLLLSNRGILKVADFGLAREYGSPLRHYTPIVVTLWYRAPELLLGIKEYSCPIDMWSVGCIFAELLTMKPLFSGKSEIDQINKIFKELGTPSDKIWPGPPSYSELPHVKKMTFTEYPYNQLRNRFGTDLSDKGFDLLNRFLTYDPKRRITAEDAKKHEYFIEAPKPVDPSMFPTWPAKSEMQKRPRRKDYEHSPKAPEGGEMFSKLKDGGDSSSAAAGAAAALGFHMPSSKKGSAAVAGFSLKF